MSAYMAHTPASHPWFSSQCKRKRGVDGYDSSLDDRLEAMGSWSPSTGGIRLPSTPLSNPITSAQNDSSRVIKKSRRFDGSSVVARRDMENEFASLSIVGGGGVVPNTLPSHTVHSGFASGSWISSGGYGSERLLPGSSTITRPSDYQDFYPPPLSSGGDGIGPGPFNKTNTSTCYTTIPQNDTSIPPMDDGPEVSMKTRSWFEPEKDRIVILDLNASDTESDAGNSEQPPTSTSSRYNSPRFTNLSNPTELTWEVSKAYLSKIPTSVGPMNSLGLDFSLPLHDPSLGAMVLFKGPGSPGRIKEEEEGPELYAHIDEVVGDDDIDMGSCPGTGCGTPMEVDEMDFD